MSRGRALLALLAVLAAVAFVPASAVAYGDVKGPPCADYVVGDIGGFGYFLDENSHGIVAGRNQLSKPACSNIAYSAIVLSADGLSTLGTAVGSPATAVGGQPVVQFMLDLGTTPPNAVCVYLTSARSDKVLDRAADTGCETILLGTPPAGRGQG